MNTHVVGFVFIAPLFVCSSACVTVAGDFGKGGGGDGGGDSGGSTSASSSTNSGSSTDSGSSSSATETTSSTDSGSSSSSTETTSSTETSSSTETTSSTETGVMCGESLPCESLSDCPALLNDCVVSTCAPSGCCDLLLLPSDTVTPTGQVEGDCKVQICDGNGSAIVDNDDSDAPDDGNPCTTNGCANGSAVFPAKAGACQLGNEPGVCGDPAGAAKGMCVQCNGDADCLAGSLCKANACTPMTLDFGGAWGYVASVLVPNPATGAASCPVTYTDTKVLDTGNIDWPFHFCSRPHQPGAEQLLEFGGMWGYVNATMANNPITGAASCPAGYTDLLVLNTGGTDWPLHVCYKVHSPGTTPEHGFAGMWGYVQDIATLNPATGASSCPAGTTSTQVFGTPNVDHILKLCWY